MKKQFITLIVFSVLFFSCQKDNTVELTQEENYQSEFATVVEDIDENNTLPEASEFYQNITEMADWYAVNPEIRKSINVTNPELETFNPVLAKLYDIKLDDKSSIFELTDDERKAFLEIFKTIEAANLSKKIERLNKNGGTSMIKERNKAFKKAFSTKKSFKQSVTDPYLKVKRELELQEKANKTVNSTKGDMDFWKQVAQSGILSFLRAENPRVSLEPQVFVDRIRPSIEKGRLLITLPGGWETFWPIVVYEGDDWYDVGHVAVINKDAYEVPAEIDADFNLSIGTNDKYGMHNEKIDEMWSANHGISFVGQVVDTKWVRVSWWRWKKVTVDANNYGIYNESTKHFGTPYCSVFQILYSKWLAPNKFICSSQGWYCAKKGAGVDMSSWWKPTIFPAGVYLSDKVKIIDNTLE